MGARTASPAADNSCGELLPRISRVQDCLVAHVVLGTHSDTPDGIDEHGVFDEGDLESEDYSVAEPVVDSGLGVLEGTVEHYLLDVVDERRQSEVDTVAERVFGSGHGVPEGTVENEVLDVLDEKSEIRNYSLD